MRGTPGKSVAQYVQAEIVLAEVVAPLRYAVGLVDGDQGQIDALEECQRVLLQQAFGGQVQQVERARPHRVDDAPLFVVREGRIQERRAYAELPQGADLILHQRDERRDDKTDSGLNDGRQLVAQGLAAACGHDDQRIAARERGGENLFLILAKIGIAVDLPQEVTRALDHPADHALF